MNLFKKTTATLALVALVSGIFSTGVSAASNSEIDAANALAASGYIVDHSDDTAAYNLNQNVLRQEIAAVARGIAGLDKKTSCDGSFTDVTATTPNTWACLSVEALLDADLIAANTMFKPENEISKAEAVGMMVKAAFGDEYSYDAGMATSWQEQVVDFAADKGVVASFTNYDTAATRGFVFEAGYNAEMAASEVVEECDEVSQLLGLCDDEVVVDDDEEDDEVVITGDNYLAAELSANTPMSVDLPLLAEGVEVLKFDVTAGSEDVSITALELSRSGFGADNSLAGAAVFTNEGRASKYKTFNSDDVASLTFSPAIVVKAGETRELTVKVNAENAVGEFAVKVMNINASSPVDASTIVSDTFEVKNVTAGVLTIADQGVNSSVKAGEEQAEVAEFKLTNNSANNNETITVSSITLKEEGTVDQEESLENISLVLSGDTISTVATMEGKYVTFNFDPIAIEEGKNEKFTVKADIMGDASKTIIFALDNVLDITAVGSTYNAINVTGTPTFTSVTINAGELTLYSDDAVKDEIRQDKKDVVLGQLRINNVAGKNLELDNLGVTITMTDEGGDDDTLVEVLENVEFEVNGTSYDLTGADTSLLSTIYSESDLDIALPQGTTILTVRADTLDSLDENIEITMTIADTDATAQFSVVETDDDTEVDDLTPSSLSWDKVTVVQSSATVANVPLANVNVVKGAADIVGLQFEIEAGKPSPIILDEVSVTVYADEDSTEVLNYDTPATNDTISEVKLYKGSVSDANLLDKVSGSNLASGVANFDGFEVEIAADATQTFIVTFSTVDIFADATDTVAITLATADLSIEDDETDTVTPAVATLADKIITISDSGSLTLTADANNDDNTDTKTILAGNEDVVYSLDTLVTNEEVKVETVTFMADEDLKNVVASAKLYLDNSVVATASNSDVTSAATAVAATATVDTDFVITADNKGTDGNSITVEFVDTGANAAGSETVAVTGTAIVVDLDAASTQAQVKTAIDASTAASALIDVVAGTAASTPGVIAAATLAGGVDGSVITFDNISDLVVPTTASELKLAIVTENIGYEKTGASAASVEIIAVTVADATGDDSGEDVTVTDLTTTGSNTFSVVPSKITPSVVASLNSSTTPQIKITADAGNNLKAATNASPTTDIDTIVFSTLGTTDANDSLVFNLVNIENSSDTVLGTLVGTTLTFDLAGDATFATTNGLNQIADGSSETFKIVITGGTVDADTLQLTLLENGITYDVDTTTGITTSLTSEIDFGSRTY